MPKDWDRIHSQLKPKLDDARRDRFRDLAQKIDAKYREQNQLGPGALAPSSSHVVDGSTLVETITKCHHPLSANDEKAAITLVDSFVKTWRLPVLRELYAKIVDVEEGEVFDAEELQEAELRRRFSLATSLLFCGKGEDTDTPFRYINLNLGAHKCTRPSEDRWDFDCLMFNREASRAVAGCVEAAGLDHRVTRVDQMDDLDARFYCRNCPLGSKLARSWRNCVNPTLVS